MTATIEIFRHGTWQPAATLSPLSENAGFNGECRFEYLLDYAAELAGPDTHQAAGLSCQYPVNFHLYALPAWPAFALDILPSGYGRQQWLEQLKIGDGPTADWPLFLRATAFPPGNLRVAEAVAAKDSTTLVPTAQGDVVAMHAHPGFSRADVVARTAAFVEYAFQHGIYAAGASDVQGVAPKLLLNQDKQGRWHAEGRLNDADVQAHWLVKRPRGNRAADRQVLRNEAAYMLVAQKLGLRVFARLEWEDDNLFVPRFDRTVHDGEVGRIGMESLYSAAGITAYGARVEHPILCAAIAKHSSAPGDDLLEYIKRDVLNVMLDNTDNHGRNSALLRHDNGGVNLAPLFDFAPMYLDPEGIARVCRWPSAMESAGNPDWSEVIALFPDHQAQMIAGLKAFADRTQNLPEIMRRCGVDDEITERRSAAIELHTRQLMRL